MSQTLTNVPVNPSKSSSDQTVQAFDSFYNQPLEIKTSTLNAMKGYFESRGFDKLAAESIAVTIIRQSKVDSKNPMEVLDTLRGLTDVQISAVVSEILNYNRFKSSFLGYAQEFVPVEEVQRNVVF